MKRWLHFICFWLAVSPSAGTLSTKRDYACTHDTPFLYNGCYGVQTDPNGLLHMRARYYNPHLCRFLNADPAGFSGGLNFYAYADGNPVSMMDPFGLGAMGAGGFSWINYTANDRIRDEYMAGYNQMQAQMASAWYGSPAPMTGGQLISSVLNMTPLLGGFKMAGEAMVGSDFLTGERIENEYSHAAWGVANLGTSFLGVVEAGAAQTATKLLGPGTSFGAKIEGQLAGRGWTQDLVQSAIDKPTRSVPWRDTRHLPGGGRMNDPATAYYSQRGGYAVRNDRTGDIIQVSDRTNPGWKAPWD